MKTISLILIALLVQLGHAYSQEHVKDSLHGILRNAADDSSKYMVQSQLTEFFIERDRDSSIFFSNACIDLATKNNMYLDVASSLSSKGHALMHLEKFSEAYTCFIDALKIANDPSSNGKTWEPKNKISGDRERLMVLARVYQTFASMMASAKNSGKSKELLLEAKKIAEENRFLANLGHINLDLGQKYFDENITDTALMLVRQAIQLLSDAGESKPLGYCNTIIGRIWQRKKNYDSALHYYRKGIAISSLSGNNTNLAANYKFLASYYLNVKQEPDSAIYYAQARLNILRESSVKDLGEAYYDISEAYRLKENKDSLIKYQALSISEKNRAFNTREIALNNLQSKTLAEQEKMMKINEMEVENRNRLRISIIAGCLIVFALVSIFLYTNNLKKQKANKALETALMNLKSTQSQLIQSEKMASLGELTAGIAHEIQNPLNFVNNFSELSNELIIDMKTEIENGNTDEAKLIADDIQQNLEKINHHGKRADAIVKGMLQHSRRGSGAKEPTNINALAEEYLRLAYHGLKAKDQSFNVTIKTDFDQSIGKINIIPQDIGRVLLNLINNAFYAVNEKKKQIGEGYEPEVTVSTRMKNVSKNEPISQLASSLIISVDDNGNGIPAAIEEKIFQPFFTTKPTGEGTGLGLSLSYDIVKAHGGEIRVESKEGEGSLFTVIL